MHHNIRAKTGHELNIDCAQREIDRRAAGGENMSRAVIDQTDYSIKIKPRAGRSDLDDTFSVVPDLVS